MPTRLAINGLGRIGRTLLRVAQDRDDLVVVALNDAAPGEQLRPLIARDSVHGTFPVVVELADGHLRLGERHLPLHAEPDPARIPWQESGATVVVEASGRFASRGAAAAHLRDAVGHVVVSANCPDADLTVCLGVNDAALDPARQRVISNASCTTNCMATVARVLDDAFGIERGLLTTVHAYTRGQELLDGPHPDPRRARAAALNIVPAATGAAQAVGLVLPALAGRLDAQAVRVPTPDVSMVHFVVALREDPSADLLADAFRAAAAGPLAGILAVSEEELVSSDFLRDPHSAVVDLPLAQEVGRRLYRVVAWYDNEWGYASRLADLCARLGGRAEDRIESAARHR